jgi:hypothetical protein
MRKTQDKMTHTIKSNTTIAYNEILDYAKQNVDIAFSLPETQTTIVYRNFNLNNDNLVGDLNKSSFSDYEVDAIVVPILLDDRILQQGEIKPGDVELFIKPYIDFESDGTIIEEPFTPKIDDEFVFNNIRYRLKLIRAERIGNTKLYIDCLCSRIENDMPDVEWNENYRTPIEGSRRGSGWD